MKSVYDLQQLMIIDCWLSLPSIPGIVIYKCTKTCVLWPKLALEPTKTDLDVRLKPYIDLNYAQWQPSILVHCRCISVALCIYNGQH